MRLIVPACFLFMLASCSLSTAQTVDSCSNVWWNGETKRIASIQSLPARKQAIISALPRAKACGQWYQCINLTNGLTYIYFAYGQLDSALGISEEAYGLSRSHIDALGDTVFPAINALNDYGALQFYYGNPKLGIEILEEAAQMIEQRSNISNISDARIRTDLQRTFHNLAANYSKLGDYEEAKRVLQRVITLKEGFKESTPEYLSPSYEELGTAYFKTGDYQQAKTWYEKALSSIRTSTIPYPRREALYVYRISQTLLNQGEIGSARNYAEQSLSIDKKSQEANILEILGTIAIKEKQYAVAESHINQSLRVLMANPAGRQEQICRLYQLLSDCLIEQGDFKQAIHTINLGFAHLAGDSDASEELFFFPNKDSIAFPLLTVGLLEKKASLSRRAWELTFLGLDAMRNHNVKAYELALSMCQKHIQSFRSERSKMFWADKMRSIVDKQVMLHAMLYEEEKNQAYLEQAFKATEMLKAAVLKEAVQDARARSLSPMFSGIESRAQALELKNTILKRKVQRLAAQDMDSLVRDSIRSEQFDVDRKLKLTEDSLFSLMQVSPLGQGLVASTDIRSIQSQLSDDQNLIQYQLVDNSIYAFVLTNKSVRMIHISNAASIKDSVQVYNELLRSAESVAPKRFATIGHKLYTSLFAPLGSLKKRLIIVPDGVLFQLPFEALIMAEPSGMRYQDWDWLLLHHTISYSHSSSLWASKQTQLKYQGWIGIAPVDFGNGLLPLHKSTVELEQIEAILKKEGIEGERFFKEGANKQAFLTAIRKNQKPPGILHFSTHAASNGTFPKDSWLAFSGEGDTAKLFLDELYALPLNADLVVLSACETQTGKVAKSEGVMSLARAFRYAGAHSVVASLWPTYEEASAIIMTQFYKHLAEGYAKDEALSLARIHYLQHAPVADDRLSPRFWAPFVATGDMEAVFAKNGWMKWAFGAIATCFIAVLLYVVLRGKKIPKALTI